MALNSTRAAQAAPKSAPKSGGSSDAGSARLGNNVRIVDHAGKRAARVSALAAKRTAALLLRPHDEKFGLRVSKCGYVAWSSEVVLRRTVQTGGDAVGSLAGLVSCHSVWACPCCSARISSHRRGELNHLLSWARGEGHAVVMLTLTARHNVRTALPEFLGDLKEAQRRLRQSKGWRALGLVGSVVATEVTHGRNGWHPHSHLLLVFPGSESDALAAVEGLRPEWLRSLAKVGRDGNGAAFQVQGASQAGEYVTTMAAADEIALGRSKLGREGSRTPWQLLADARDGDRRAAALWVEFALAFKGRSQLVWSRGLKKLCALDDVPDDEAGTVEDLRQWPGSSDEWRAARRRRAALLTAAETGDDLDRAEYGATDAARWIADAAAVELVEAGEEAPAPVDRIAALATGPDRQALFLAARSRQSWVSRLSRDGLEPGAVSVSCGLTCKAGGALEPPVGALRKSDERGKSYD